MTKKDGVRRSKEEMEWESTGQWVCDCGTVNKKKGRCDRCRRMMPGPTQWGAW